MKNLILIIAILFCQALLAQKEKAAPTDDDYMLKYENDLVDKKNFKTNVPLSGIAENNKKLLKHKKIKIKKPTPFEDKYKDKKTGNLQPKKKKIPTLKTKLDPDSSEGNELRPPSEPGKNAEKTPTEAEPNTKKSISKTKNKKSTSKNSSKKISKRKKKKSKPVPTYKLSELIWSQYLGRRLSLTLPISYGKTDESEIKRIYSIFIPLSKSRNRMNLPTETKTPPKIPWKLTMVNNNQLIFRHSPGRYLFFSNTQRIAYDELLAMSANVIAHEALSHKFAFHKGLPRIVKTKDWKKISTRVWEYFVKRSELAYDAQKQYTANLLAIQIIKNAKISGEIKTKKSATKIMMDWLEKLAQRQNKILLTGPYEKRHPGAAWQKKHIMRLVKTHKLII